MTYVPAPLRRQVRERAGAACEYCLIPEAMALVSHEVDHIVAQKHGGATDADNLALSCTLCNKHKGSDLASIDPETGALTPLFHPRRQRWSEQFQLVDAMIVPLTPAGRATVRLLQLNHPDRLGVRVLLIAAELIPPPA
jgi:hypothetical protein